MDLWNSANKDPRKRTRMAIKAGIQDVLRCTVQKGANVHLPMHQEAGHAGAAAEALLPDWRIVKGSACTNFAHAEDMVYRRNIILQEQDGTVLLQRRDLAAVAPRDGADGGLQTVDRLLQTLLRCLYIRHDELTQRFTEAQDAQASLEKVIDKVSERLDTTIGRLKAVLDS